MSPGSFGARVRRSSDPRLLTGRGAYIDDLKLPGMVHMAVWRSPLAHARVERVALDRALGLAGVVDAFDVRAFGESPPSFPVVLTHESLKSCPQYPLAKDRVRYVGEGVAVVLAEARAIAEDALELLDVSLDPLEPVASTEVAQRSTTPLLHDQARNNVCAEWTLQLGDADGAFQQADVIVRESFAIQRHTGVPIETRGVVAHTDPISGELVIWVSGQWPHATRSLAARMLALPEASVRVVVPDVGGGFGVKEEFYPEDLLVPFAARRLGRPVKWIEDRREHFLSVVHAREQTHQLELALRRDGTIVGLRDRIVTDMGAYVRALGFVNPSLAAASVPGPYRVADVRIDSVAVVTNKSPVSPYRGAGQPEATFVRERLLDIAAAELGLDPADIRRRNLLPPEALPFDTGISSVDGPVRFDSGDFPRALETALELLDYPRLRQTQASARRAGRLPGIGFAVYAQITGTGAFEGADVRVSTDGRVTVNTGAVDIGQGLATALAQVVADELQLPIERIRVLCGDTARIPHGVGTFASRGAVMAGNAASVAAGQVRTKAVELAAHLLEVAPGDVDWRDGCAWVRGVSGRSVSLAELAAACRPGEAHRPPGMPPSLEARHYFESEDPPFAYGVHAVVIEVDPETGAVRLERYVVVSDSGRLINPMIAEGQIVGGIAQGLGGALLERLVYDSEAQLLSSSLLDYALPTARDVPTVEMVHLEIPTPLNPLGVKGLGEGGAVGAHAAVANAVADALLPLGIKVRATPLSPGVLGPLMHNGGGRDLHSRRTMTPMTTGDLYVQAMTSTQRYLDGVRPTQWSGPTPCTEWDVKQVANHIIGENLWAGELFNGRTIDQVGNRFDGDLAGDDPAAAYRKSVDAARASVEAPGAMETTCHLSFGDCSGSEYAGQLFMDLLIHGWDIAKATGQDTRLDADLVAACLPIAQQMTSQFRGSGVFGEDLLVASDADPQIRLLGLVGRQA